MVDEDQIYLSTFIKGYLIGIIILYIIHRFFGHQFYLWKVMILLKLVLIFNYELMSSSLSTMYHILFIPHRIAPGVVTYIDEEELGNYKFNDADYINTRFSSASFIT